MKVIREYKMREDVLDQQASLQRARLHASLADGISWGMGEDAIEEAEVYDILASLNRIFLKLPLVSCYCTSSMAFFNIFFLVLLTCGFGI